MKFEKKVDLWLSSPLDGVNGASGRSVEQRWSEKEMCLTSPASCFRIWKASLRRLKGQEAGSLNFKAQGSRMDLVVSSGPVSFGSH